MSGFSCCLFIKYHPPPPQRALAAFNVPNKEGMFHMIVSFNFLIGLLHGMLAKLGDVERASKQRVSSAGNPGKLQTLNVFAPPPFLPSIYCAIHLVFG